MKTKNYWELKLTKQIYYIHVYTHNTYRQKTNDKKQKYWIKTALLPTKKPKEKKQWKRGLVSYKLRRREEGWKGGWRSEEVKKGEKRKKYKNTGMD